MHLSIEQIGAYVDAQLSPAERKAAQAHIDACSECRREVTAFEAITGMVAAHAVEPSASFESEGLAKLRALPMPKRPWWKLTAWRMPAAAFASLALVAFGYVMFAPTKDSAIPVAAVVEETEVAEQAEFLENMDMLEELDVLEAMDEKVPG